jgi:hypothetical protein
MGKPKLHIIVVVMSAFREIARGWSTAANQGRGSSMYAMIQGCA